MNSQCKPRITKSPTQTFPTHLLRNIAATDPSTTVPNAAQGIRRCIFVCELLSSPVTTSCKHIANVNNARLVLT